MKRSDFLNDVLSMDAKKGMVKEAVALEILSDVDIDDIKESAKALMDRNLTMLQFEVRSSLVFEEGTQRANSVRFSPNLDELPISLVVRHFRFISLNWDQVIFDGILYSNATNRAEQLATLNQIGEVHDLSFLQVGAQITAFYDATVGWGAIYSVNGNKLALPARFQVPPIDAPEVYLFADDEFYNPQKLTLGGLPHQDKDKIPFTPFTNGNSGGSVPPIDTSLGTGSGGNVPPVGAYGDSGNPGGATPPDEEGGSGLSQDEISALLADTADETGETGKRSRFGGFN